MTDAVAVSAPCMLPETAAVFLEPGLLLRWDFWHRPHPSTRFGGLPAPACAGLNTMQGPVMLIGFYSHCTRLLRALLAVHAPLLAATIAGETLLGHRSPSVTPPRKALAIFIAVAGTSDSGCAAVQRCMCLAAVISAALLRCMLYLLYKEQAKRMPTASGSIIIIVRLPFRRSDLRYFCWPPRR